MTEVYVDVEAASESEAARALGFLSEAGVKVVVIGDDDAHVPADVRAVADAIMSAVPARPGAPAWYLTSEVARCQGSSAALRTVFIGGAPPGGSVRRCDAVARDVQAAAMEILAVDASAPAGAGR